MQRVFLLSMASLAMLIQSSFSFASGGYSGGVSRSPSAAPQRQVDQTYETGKAIFTGRAKGEPSLEYCIAVDGEKVPVQRKTVKAYKEATYNDFARGLYRCDQPDTLIAESLTRDSLLHVVYYLNKRHKLKLRAS